MNVDRGTGFVRHFRRISPRRKVGFVRCCPLTIQPRRRAVTRFDTKTPESCNHENLSARRGWSRKRV